jgi:hypothetical protein
MFHFARQRHAYFSLIALTAAVAAGWLAHRASLRVHLRRFAVVQEGVLYRSAQPTAGGVLQLVEGLGVKTVVCLRRELPQLCRGFLDPRQPSGPAEGDLVTRLGATHRRWLMGGEAHWPWFSGQQFEDFFRLMDEPANFPVAVHCIGGRHRTGTFVALYRMEYDRWDVDAAVREMYSFNFGNPAPIQDHNLRTYWPRPRPETEQWTALRTTFADSIGPSSDYAAFIRRLRALRETPRIEAALQHYIAAQRPLALALAQRVVDDPGDPLVPLVCQQAIACLRRDDVPADDWSVAAALVADFGTAPQQRVVLDILQREPHADPPSPKYHAVVRGVTNRFTPNRIAFLRPLLDDARPRPEPTAVYRLGEQTWPGRYCDTAVARLCTILDLYGVSGPEQWDQSRELFWQWFAEHPEAMRLVRLGESAVQIRSDREAAMEDRDDYRR